tara:strand:+ start:1405 stop:2484 length:1080 start_codon:yes stop_codon:yes gene_type:complete
LKSKKKILIVENLMHFWQVDDVYKIFSKNFDCNVILPKKYRHISNLKDNIITSGLRYFMYLHVILIGRRYDYIYLCSCPEYPDYPNNFKNLIIYFQQLLIFLLLIIFFRKKIICYVRGLHRIFPDAHKNYMIKFFIYFRYLIFNLLNLFICENENLTNIFKKKFKRKNFKVTTMYTRYFDKDMSYQKNYNQSLVIGVLGGIDPQRKNYDLLYDGVYDFKDKIKIVFLGKFNEKLSTNVIHNFSSFNIEFEKKILSEKDFLRMGKDCDLLISLNREEKHYGQFKGTGSFGDSMYLQKTLIAPAFADPINEFDDFCYYYNNEYEFKIIIEKILSKQIRLNSKFDKFEISTCSKKIINDLNI